MAERLAAACAVSAHRDDFTVSSAGTSAVVGHPIHDDAVRVLEHRGIDSTGFAARQLKPRIALDADLILTMTRAHRDSVLGLAPRQLKRTFTLSEAAQLVATLEAQTVADLASLRPRLSPIAVTDIADPIGQGAEFFETVGAQIAELIPLIVRLRHNP